MKLAQDVYLHLNKMIKFKTNHITFRFSGVFNSKTVARRVLVAQMLATSNNTYPSFQLFKKKLADLYGVQLSTNISTKGLVHIIDIDISFLSDSFLPEGSSLLEETVAFLREVLFNPLVAVEHYQTKTFETEKTNLMRYLDSDKEDPFYYSYLELQKLFFKEKTIPFSKYASADLVEAENSYTAYQEFQKMLREDRIDIFVLGDFDKYHALQLFEEFPLVDRQTNLQFNYRQGYSNIANEKIERKENQQSILQLGYYSPIAYGEEDYYPLLILNGILGGYPHSKLFTEIRESAGLSYNIGSRLDVYRGLLHIYAGIDSKQRPQTLQLVNKQMSDLKLGRISSHLVSQTKRMLLSSAHLSKDNPKSLIEVMYNQQIFGAKSLTLSQWIDKIDKVSKDDISRVASLIKLQSIYFLEGE
ncbi:EF-P 5-aminopentanol modification-associated protein YfmF [Streptococcus macacae]|uniref:Peptidase M16 inactive domain protein n=1 Tax=Streptococcus macacae NCTC 11558 TaxID=764298 RepID=G5JXI9_9STRE|nr:pitrilysin family protein [Streptococcus macacae]EHJ52434.1 peptidase M16 inactive domain protein [Streptococcus macacae NCTC 11558]SUN79762.1 peptidase [Streptococcus macacae NCTC 11558]